MFKRTPSYQKRKRDFGHKPSSIKEEFVDRQILVLHAAIADKMLAQAKTDSLALVEQVRAVLDQRRDQGRMRYGEHLTWHSLLELIHDPDAFRAGMLEDTPQMKKYRRRTPFVGILSEEERTQALEKNAIGYLDLV